MTFAMSGFAARECTVSWGAPSAPYILRLDFTDMTFLGAETMRKLRAGNPVWFFTGAPGGNTLPAPPLSGRSSDLVRQLRKAVPAARM